MKTLAALAVMLFVSGCATVDRGKLLGPDRVDQPADDAYAWVKTLPVQQCYDSMKAASTDQSLVSRYVDSCIALNAKYCAEWLDRVGAAERDLRFGKANLGVAQNLGTALFGIFAASPLVVATWGAANVALSGWSDAFDVSVLAAPSSRNIRPVVNGMLDDAAEQLRADPDMTFSEASVRLGNLYRICTFTTIQDAVNASLATTQTTVSVKSGRLFTAPRDIK